MLKPKLIFKIIIFFKYITHIIKYKNYYLKKNLF